MATHHGTEGLVKVATATVAEVTGFTFTQTAEYAEDTALADTDKTYSTVAIKSWSGNVSCFWDETDTNGQVAMAPGVNVALKLYPEGATSGDTFYEGNALITDITRTVSRGAITEITFNFIGNGALTTTTVSP
jgi:hypothetical protein